MEEYGEYLRCPSLAEAVRLLQPQIDRAAKLYEQWAWIARISWPSLASL
jgi:hypothetical protein